MTTDAERIEQLETDFAEFKREVTYLLMPWKNEGDNLKKGDTE